MLIGYVLLAALRVCEGKLWGIPGWAPGESAFRHEEGI